jgi:hypothetical protein
VPLAPGDGVVDLGRAGRPDPGRLLTPDGRVIPLPFDGTTVRPEAVAADRDGYIAVAKARREAPCRSIWRLIPGEGATETACLPEAGSSRVVRTALGWVYDKREYKDGCVNDSGIFLETDSGTAVKLAAGFTENLAVSPDGCRIAFGHAPDLQTSCTDGTYKRKTLKLIDLCANKAAIMGR